MNFENLEFHIIDYNKIMAIIKQKSIYNSNKPIYIVIRVLLVDSLSPRLLCLYFRTLPFDKLVQRAAEEKHEEFFISEVTALNILSLESINMYILGGFSYTRILDIQEL